LLGARRARTTRGRVYAGSRHEQVDALARDIDVATANLVYAKQQFSCTSQLLASGFASHQDLDKATAAVEMGNATLSRARSDARPPVSGRQVRNVQSLTLASKLPRQL
jgi:multidrug resistance efflux pump